MHEVFENLNILLGGDTDAINEIARDFSMQMEVDLPQVITHIHNEQLTAARKLAHKLKGSVMNFKLPEMLEAFKALEKALDETDIATANNCLTVIQDELSKFNKLIKPED